jgi:hypothetical protein
MINNMRKLNFSTIVIVIFLGLLFFGFARLSAVTAATTATTATTSADAIAIRIMPNPNHYSITRWYADQGFEGSPQSLTVDGYDAIRDGRTVYINAANIDQSSNPPLIYTNIYLISYNQNPAANTVDILGQIIANWKFNNGLTDSANPAPSCSISAVSCSSNSDCGSGQACSTSAPTAGSCVLTTTKNCAVDADCPTNFFCDSLKSKITRDVKRVGQLTDLNQALDNFKTANGHYPLLSAGTYLVNNSVSLWPSWTQGLLTDLAVAQSSVDPINRLGACSGYDQTTCWNKDTQRFFSNPSVTATLVLPANSYAFAYSTNSTGSKYNLCATLESRATAWNYHFTPNDPANSACILATGVNANAQAVNSAPQLTDQMLTGAAGQEFNGFIKVVDPDGDPLTWQLNTSASSWSGWSKAPALVATSNVNQKKIYAQSAGGPGTYQMSITVDDGRGGTLNTSTPITILSSDISIQAANADYTLNSATPFSYTIYFSGASLASSPSYSVVKTSGTGDLLAGLTKILSTASANSYQVTYSGAIPTTLNLSKGGSFSYKVTVTDKYSKTSAKYFTINILPEPVTLKLNCAAAARVKQSYSCMFNSTAASLYYTVTGLPAGLYASDLGFFGTPVFVDIYPLTVTATNQYGTSVTQTFTLQVNNYCGDGTKQLTNTEGTGGPYNDGHEDCDGTDGLTASTTLSNIGLQYGCDSQCTYLSPTKGGGYCGDGYCEVKVGDTSRENCANCPDDCGTCVATVSSYSKQEQMAYFNGTNIYKSTWPTLGSSTVTLLTGKNVFGFWIHTLQTTATNYGLAYQVTVGPTSTPYDVLDTANSNLRCAAGAADSSLSGDSYNPSTELTNQSYNWPDLGYTETNAFSFSTVLSPLATSPLNSLPFIWGKTSSSAATAFYCRLTYNTKTMGVCRPRCQGLQCGPDGCGGTCGTCSSSQDCNPYGQCVTPACSTDSQCNDSNACTTDTCVYPKKYNAYCSHANNTSIVSCTATFGTCQAAGLKTCSNGVYGSCVATSQDPRIANCSGKTCGSNGCGGTCGSCSTGQTCNTSGQCVSKNCEPGCFGRCGGLPDDCGNICAANSCSSSQTCVNQHCVNK